MKRGLRRRLVLTVIGAFALGLVVLLAGFNLVLAGQQSREVNRELRSRAAAQQASLDPAARGVRVRESPNDAYLDRQVWVFSKGRPVERAAADPSAAKLAASLAAVGRETMRETGDTRLLAEPVSFHGRRAGTVVVGASLVPYKHTREIALAASIALGLLLLLLVAVLARRTVSGALAPVHQMTELASSWSEHDLHRRFGLGAPRDEFTDLAATLDGLLDRVDASLRREQRLTAEIAHELRTPLARQRAEAELALGASASRGESRAALEGVLTEVDAMTSVIDTLLAAAQADADPARGACDASSVAECAAEATQPRARESGKELTVLNPAAPIALGLDQDLAVRILVPLIDNAVRYGSSWAQVACARDRTQVRFTVSDDGPGLTPEDLRHVFEPGFRGRAARQQPGSGLGLSLSRRLARTAGGDVTAAAGLAGARFQVALPIS